MSDSPTFLKVKSNYLRYKKANREKRKKERERWWGSEYVCHGMVLNPTSPTWLWNPL